MRKATTAIALATRLPDRASISDISPPSTLHSVHKWLDDDAVPPYGDSAPAGQTDIVRFTETFCEFQWTGF